MINWKKLRSRLPNRIQLSKNCFYEILWVDSFLNPDILGETRFDDRQIVLKNGFSPKETVCTYLHEVTHAVSEEYKIGLTETQVLALESSLKFILKNDNLFKGTKNERRRKASKRIRKARKKTR